MRRLSFERQIDVVVRLGDGPDAFNNGPPVLAFVIAIKHVAVRRAGKDRIAAVPHIHRHAFDVGADMLRQAAAQDVPGLAAVAAARHAGIRGVKISPGARPGLGAGDEQQVGILRMDEERIDVADSKIPWRHALPAHAPVAADAEPRGRFRAAIGRRRCAVQLARIVGWNEHAMRVGIDIVLGRPGFAPVRALEKAADFHGHVDDVGIGRMKSNALVDRRASRTAMTPSE